MSSNGSESKSAGCPVTPIASTMMMSTTNTNHGFGEPAVLVMEDGATATLYSAQDGSTILESPEGVKTVVPASPLREEVGATEVLPGSLTSAALESVESKTSFVLRPHASTASPTARENLSESTPSASTTVHVLPKNLAAIVVGSNQVSLGTRNGSGGASVAIGSNNTSASGGLFHRTQGVPIAGKVIVDSSGVTSSNTINIPAPLLNNNNINKNKSGLVDDLLKTELSSNTARTYGNKNFIKRQQIFRPSRAANNNNSDSLVSTAISRNVIDASKQGQAVSYVIRSATEISAESTDKKSTTSEPPNFKIVDTTATKRLGGDFTVVPRIAVAVMSSNAMQSNQAINTLVLASSEGSGGAGGGENSSSTTVTTNANLTRLCQKQMLSAGNTQNNLTPTILATLPAISFVEATTLNNNIASPDKIMSAAVSNVATVRTLENGRVIRATALLPQQDTTSPTTIYMREPVKHLQEYDDTNVATNVVVSSGSPEDATVTTAVYESGAGTAIVDSNAGMATLIKGAEVVRSSAVSYATPIMHQVFFQTRAVDVTDTGAAAGNQMSTTCEDISSEPTTTFIREVSLGYRSYKHFSHLC